MSAKIAVEPRQAAAHVIEDAPLPFEHRQPRGGVCALAVAEEPLEDRARIVLNGQRRRLAAPGDGVGVGAAITAVAIAGELVRFDAEFERGELRMLAEFLRGYLVG